MKKVTSKFLGGADLAYMRKVAKAVKAYDATGKLDPKFFRVERVLVPAKPAEVRGLRKALDMDRTTLAAAIGVSRDTVKAWELGKRVPEGPATKLLRYLGQNPKQLPKLQAI